MRSGHGRHAAGTPAATSPPTPDPVPEPPPEPPLDPTPDLTPPRPAPEDGAAAAPGDGGEEPTGRQRLAEAMARPWSRAQLVVALLLGLLGFAAVAQVQATDQGGNFVGARQADLIALINTLSLATDRAEAEIAELQETREALQDDADRTSTALEVARRQTEELEILAGTVPAVGPGVRVTVEGPPGTIGTDQLLNGLQELRSAGAEVIEVNDAVRVVAQTGLVDSPDGGLIVDGSRVEPPYVLDVIGDPQTLETALDFQGGFIEAIEQVGGNVTVEQLDAVEVTATRPLQEPSFARAVPQE